ncbi:methyltransferase [Spongiimicrobium salis]|uniref:methyltransferase n=1 Tax=Spongiimicrobium salis TaxID=1667022 RepID=UPI00374D2440
MRAFLKKLTHPFLKKGAQWYYSKPRKYRYDDIEVLVHPDVFPPHLTLSTKILLDFMSPMELQGKRFLELGCGSGIVALYASKKGAKVTATDINTTALSFLEKAADHNQCTVEIRHSDLFENLREHHFDYIFINPPYYPRKAKNIKEQAWFCGEDFEYFKKLFQQLPSYLEENAQTYMILSEDCQIATIQKLAIHQGISMKVIHKKKVAAEMNYIYTLALSTKN